MTYSEKHGTRSPDEQLAYELAQAKAKQPKLTNTSRTEVERVAAWLDAKWKRHGEPEDKEATALILALKAERDALREELSIRRKPLNAPGDEDLLRNAEKPIPSCTCVARGSDDPHGKECPFWLTILSARKAWRDKHVVAWSCSQEARGKVRCDQWCGLQQYCPASTLDAIDLALKGTP
jgi:hypothetical protein